MLTMITAYKQAQEYLDSFINYEKIPSFSYSRALKPQRMKYLMEHLGIDIGSLRTLHIAGTKGKGSTAWLCAWLLAGCGYRVGLYTSPHLYDFRERIQILARNQSGKIRPILISPEAVTQLSAAIQSRLAPGACMPRLEGLSFFEVYTAMALQYFLQERVDFAVIETGLGGRLDATNVIRPAVALITHIGYDHTNTLGKKLREITAEKAGIIKKDISVVCASQRPSVLSVIQEHCRRQHAPLFVYGRDFTAAKLHLLQDVTRFDYSFCDYRLHDITMRLRGSYQVENAACALAALCLLKDQECVADISGAHRALSHLMIEGRFETVSSNPLIVMDIAHNASSFKVLQDNLKHYYPSKEIIFIFACSQDKDARTMLNSITSEHLILTRFSSPRANDPYHLQKLTYHQNVMVAATPQEALFEAIRLCHSNAVIVVSGSLFLVSDIKKIIQRAPRVGTGRPAVHCKHVQKTGFSVIAKN